MRFCFILFILGGSCLANAATYYVSSSPAAKRDGLSIETPLATIADCARTAKAGDTCVIRGGDYRETVVPAYSGSSGSPVTFTNYHGEAVTIRGTERVAGWIVYQGTIFQAPAPHPSLAGYTDRDIQVFVDGQMMHSARWPNSGLDPMNPTFSQITSAAGGTFLCDSSLAGVAGNNHFAGALLHITPGLEWWSDTSPITESGVGGPCAAGEGYLKFQPLADRNIQGAFTPQKYNPYYILGNLSDLDGPGEFYYDTPSQTLYLWTPLGDDPANHKVEIKTRAYAFNLSGRSHVTLKNLNLFASTITSDASSDSLVLDSLNVSYPSHFEGQQGQSGQIIHAQDTGIVLNGQNHLLENSIIDYSAGNGVTLIGSHIRVRNNLVQHIAYTGAWLNGIFGWPFGNSFELPAHLVIEHNTVAYVGNAGIGMGNNRNVVKYNNVHHHGQFVFDVGGAFHHYGFKTPCLGNTEVAYNWFHDTDSRSAAASLIGGQPSGTGIYLDFTTKPLLIHHNVVWNENYADMILNGSAPHTTAGPSNQIYSNTFASQKLYASIASDYPSPTKDMTGVFVQDNIFLTPRTGLFLHATVDHNTEPPVLPGFVNFRHADFRLKPGSPAIGSGIVIPGINMTTDEGALPYGQTSFTAGCNFTGCR